MSYSSSYTAVTNSINATNNNFNIGCYLKVSVVYLNVIVACGNVILVY